MKTVFTISLIFSCFSLFAQAGNISDDNSIDLVSSQISVSDPIIFTGKVKEAGSDLPIDFANVTVYAKGTDTFISGTTTESGGQFELETNNKNVYITISFIGYETLVIDDFVLDGNNVSIGEILLAEEGELLNEIVVTAEKSSTEFRTDRRIFNVGADLTTSGATALEVLNNVPSVDVNIEGAVTLRGSSGVQILINGKPSVLADEESGALGNITADMIEKVEVITNPSAKYEAEGSSGIINIILKKNNKKAVNGSVTLNTGIPENHSLGFSINKRTENFNLFAQAGIGSRVREFDVINTTSNILENTSLNTIGTEARNEDYYNIVIGADYYINPKNVITLSGAYTFEKEDQPSFTTFNFTDNGVTNSWTRSEVTEAANPKYQYDLQYKKEFDDDKNHQLSISAIGNYFSKDQSSTFTEELKSGVVDVADQLTATNFKESKFVYNLDYTKPFMDHFTIESGLQFIDNEVSNDYSVEDLIGDEFVVNNGLTNIFEYDQKVLGVYTTGAYEKGRWGLKAGTRVERTDLTTFLANSGETNEQTFIDLFPSLHLSYKISDGISLQSSYSSRIYRPRLWDLNPFFNVRNDFSVRAGNPLLMPEYTDSYEIGSIFIYDKISFNVNAYQRITSDKIEYISTFADNVRVFSPMNVGSADTKGLELNFKYSPIKKLTLNGDINYNYFTREGSFNGENFDFSNDQWSTKLTTKLKLNKSFDFEATGRYNSAVQMVQGIQSENLFMDIGARYKLLDGKIVANLSVRDVFASRIRESFVFDENIENYSFRQLGRFITFGVSYGFGKGEAMTYGGGGRRR